MMMCCSSSSTMRRTSATEGRFSFGLRGLGAVFFFVGRFETVGPGTRKTSSEGFRFYGFLKRIPSVIMLHSTQM